MGRYYNGDIEGKFWVGVQSSDDASYFGGTEYEPNTISYSFDEDDMEDIKEGLKKCIDTLGDKMGDIEKFFKDKNSYNDKMVADTLKITEEKASEYLEVYARYLLGLKIEKCVRESGHCDFEAEC